MSSSCCRAENRVGYRMTQHIGIGMASKAGLVRYLDATNNETPPRFQAMQVVSDANSRHCADVRSQSLIPASAFDTTKSCSVVILMFVDSPSTSLTV